RAAFDNFGRLRLDRRRKFHRSAEIEESVAMVDDGERLERVEAEGILWVAVKDRRRPPDRLRPKPGSRPVGRRLVEWDAPDDRINADKVARVPPPHERERAGIGRFHTATLERP